MTTIDVIKQTSAVTDARLDQILIEISNQVNGEFLTDWSIPLSLTRQPSRRAGSWVIYIKNAPCPIPNAAAFHVSGADTTYAADGAPAAYVYISSGDTQQNWVHALGHEVLEMLVNSFDSAILTEDPAYPNQKRYMSLEVCDTVYTGAVYYVGSGSIPLTYYVNPDYFKPEMRNKNGYLTYYGGGNTITQPFQTGSGLPGIAVISNPTTFTRVTF